MCVYMHGDFMASVRAMDLMMTAKLNVTLRKNHTVVHKHKHINLG